jgi:hypothetical protein
MRYSLTNEQCLFVVVVLSNIQLNTVRISLPSSARDAAACAARQVSSTLRALHLLKSESVERLVGAAVQVAVPAGAVAPLATLDLETTFLAAAEAVFWEGKSLGSPFGGVTTTAINHLSLGLLAHFVSRGRFTAAEEFFSKFRPMDAEVGVRLFMTFRACGSE